MLAQPHHSLDDHQLLDILVVAAGQDTCRVRLNDLSLECYGVIGSVVAATNRRCHDGEYDPVRR